MLSACPPHLLCSMVTERITLLISRQPDELRRKNACLVARREEQAGTRSEETARMRVLVVVVLLLTASQRANAAPTAAKQRLKLGRLCWCRYRCRCSQRRRGNGGGLAPHWWRQQPVEAAVLFVRWWWPCCRAFKGIVSYHLVTLPHCSRSRRCSSPRRHTAFFAHHRQPRRRSRA